MAKVKGPLFSVSASGNIKKTFLFSSWRGIPVVKQYVDIPDTLTDKKGAVRLAYSAGCDAWNDLTAAEKEPYKETGQRKNLTGFNVFISQYLNNHIEDYTTATYGTSVYGTGRYV